MNSFFTKSLFMRGLSVACLAASTLILNSQAEAQSTPPPAVGINPDFLSNSYLEDRNGDGQIKLAAFGDSITRGVGDFTSADEEVYSLPLPAANQEAGYPLRIEKKALIGVANLGDPGEVLSTEGLPRYAQLIPSGGYDVIMLSGGSNDARDKITRSDFFRSVQTMINIGSIVGAQVVLVTAPPACCNHGNLSAFVREYDSTYRTLAFVNDVPLADVYQAFANTCELGNCKLLGLPEGLHPNTSGYDVMGEMVISTLLGIDLLTTDGASQYEVALNLPPGSVLTKPNPVVE